MKAIHLHARGGPEQLVYEDAPKPQLRPGDALVRVCACAFTPTELTWDPTYTTRDGAGRLPSIPGHELSGVVEAVSANGNGAKVGDQVYALADFWRDGAAADYIAIRDADLAPKPANLNFVQAAALPLSALTAWQALFGSWRAETGRRSPDPRRYRGCRKPCRAACALARRVCGSDGSDQKSCDGARAGRR